MVPSAEVPAVGAFGEFHGQQDLGAHRRGPALAAPERGHTLDPDLGPTRQWHALEGRLAHAAGLTLSPHPDP